MVFTVLLSFTTFRPPGTPPPQGGISQVSILSLPFNIASFLADLPVVIDWCMPSCFHSYLRGNSEVNDVKGIRRSFIMWVFFQLWILPFFHWNALFSWALNPNRTNLWSNYKIEHLLILRTSGFFSLASAQIDYFSFLLLLASMSCHCHLN